jgi:predicted PhzF superfamily epimerase YddE/YHI9
MTLPIYQVDAFAQEVFSVNPHAVVYVYAKQEEVAALSPNASELLAVAVDL